ncbi:MAG: tRNA glutamyl-Q(34) synthetase GluQRS [Planctomycetota bacterium]
MHPRPRGRLAPSPTGHLHLGHARSLVAAWLASAGNLDVRLEDVNASRCREEYAGSIERDLGWLGLTGGGPLPRQSARSARYQEALEALWRQGRAYPCVCTRKDIDEAGDAPHGPLGPVYPGTCRGRFASGQEAAEVAGAQPAWRLDLQGWGAMEFADRLQGPQSLAGGSELGDVVIWSKEGHAAYQLAVVLDDADGGVEVVVRGADLIPSTFVQIVLQEALGLPRPAYAHLGLVRGAEGERLSKRAGSLALGALRERGVQAPEVLGWVAESLGLGAGVRSLEEGARRWDDARIVAGDVRVPGAWS